MTSKEFIQKQLKLTKTALKDNENVFSKEMKSLYEEDIKQYNQVLKDLEELEELKKIMGTPIQDIMKKLRKLEVIEKHFAYDDKETRFKLIKPISIEDDEILKEMVK